MPFRSKQIDATPVTTKARIAAITLILASIVGIAMFILTRSPDASPPTGRAGPDVVPDAEDVAPMGSEGAQLTPEETMGVVFAAWDDGTPWGWYKRANPSVRPQLYMILQRDDLRRYHVNALRILGYIGDSTDVQRIEAYFQRDYYNRAVVRTGWEAAPVSATFQALGLMSHRGIEDADESLDRMTTLKYWEGSRFRWYPEEADKRYPAGWMPFEGLTRALLGLAIADPDRATERRNLILKSIQDPEIKRRMGGRVSDQVITDYSRELRSKERQDPEEDPRISIPQSRLPRFFNGNFKNPAPAVPNGGNGKAAGPECELLHERQTLEDLDADVPALRRVAVHRQPVAFNSHVQVAGDPYTQDLGG